MKLDTFKIGDFIIVDSIYCKQIVFKVGKYDIQRASGGYKEKFNIFHLGTEWRLATEKEIANSIAERMFYE